MTGTSPGGLLYSLKSRIFIYSLPTEFCINISLAMASELDGIGKFFLVEVLHVAKVLQSLS